MNAVYEPDPGVPYDPDAGPAPPTAPDPCTSIVQGGNPDVDELERAGLEPAVVPQFLIDQFDEGGVYCLSDLKAGVVEGVYTEFWAEEAIVARWLIPGTPTAGSDSWEEYLARLTGGGDPQALEHGILSILPSNHESMIRAEVAPASDVEYISLWHEVAKTLGSGEE